MRTHRWLRKREIVSIIDKFEHVTNPRRPLGDPTTPTMTDIAFWLGIGPSTHLLKLLYEMEQEGLIFGVEFTHRRGITANAWRVGHEGKQLLAQMRKERLSL